MSCADQDKPVVPRVSPKANRLERVAQRTAALLAQFETEKAALLQAIATQRGDPDVAHAAAEFTTGTIVVLAYEHGRTASRSYGVVAGVTPTGALRVASLSSITAVQANTGRDYRSTLTIDGAGIAARTRAEGLYAGAFEVIRWNKKTAAFSNEGGRRCVHLYDHVRHASLQCHFLSK